MTPEEIDSKFGLRKFFVQMEADAVLARQPYVETGIIYPHVARKGLSKIAQEIKEAPTPC